jgi:hypothetical protein
MRRHAKNLGIFFKKFMKQNALQAALINQNVPQA